MPHEKQVTKELMEKMSPGYIEQVLTEGYAGFSAAGVFVDRREDPQAVVVKKNSKLGIPAPAEVRSSTPPDAPVPPEAPAPPAVTPGDKSEDSPGNAAKDNPPPVRDQQSQKKALTSFRFEFEILDGRRQIVDRQYVSVDANSESEAIDQAVAKLQVKEGCTHRYTGQFSRKPAEA